VPAFLFFYRGDWLFHYCGFITAPLSTKRSWRAASEEFDCTLKKLLFAVILTPHPAGEIIVKSVIYCSSFDKEELARSV